MKRHPPIIFLLILSHLILISSISVNLSFPLDTPKNSLIFNFTNHVPELYSDLNLYDDNTEDFKIIIEIFSLENDSLFLTENFYQNPTEYLFIVTFKRSDLGLDYVLFNISTFSVQNGPIISKNIFRGVIPINSAPFSIISGLTDAYFTCQTDTKCFHSFSFSCATSSCPFELELLRVTSQFYISAYTTETILTESIWNLNISIRNWNQNMINLELIIDAIDDILFPVFKMTSLAFEFPETTNLGAFLFKPEISNYWSNNSYTFSLQSNLAAYFLNLDADTGEIFLRSNFYSEFRSAILVAIEVRFIEIISVTVIQSISTANFLINVIDTSEFAPIFSLPMYESMICTDIPANQFLAYTPLVDGDVTDDLYELRIESNENEVIQFQLELNLVWVGQIVPDSIRNVTGYIHTFNLFAFDSVNKNLFSQTLLVIRLTKCVTNTPLFYRNPIELVISPNCPILYHFNVFYDQAIQIPNTTILIQGRNQDCQIDSNYFLNCSKQKGNINLMVSAVSPSNDTSHGNISFIQSGQNIFTSPKTHSKIKIVILKSANKIVYNFSNMSNFELYKISGFLRDNSTFLIENSFLKLASNPSVGEFNFEVLGMNKNYSIPFEIFYFKIEILSGFSTGNISLKIPFVPTNTSIYTFRPEYGAFTYHIKNNTRIPLAINPHSGVLSVTKLIREYSNFKFQVFARDVKTNLFQSISVKVIFNSEFQIYSCPLTSRILVTLPKARNAKLYKLNLDNKNVSLTILGENKIFAISNSSIILKSHLSYFNPNTTLSILMRQYNNLNLVTENICHFQIIFSNSTFFPVSTYLLTHHIKIPFCTPKHTHIFKLPTLRKGEYKLVPKNAHLEILANGSLIYTGSQPAYTAINQSIHLLYNSTEILVARLNIEFAGLVFEDKLNFTVKSDTQIGTKIGTIWNYRPQPCTYFLIQSSESEIPFHIDSATGEIYISFILTEGSFKFSIEATQHCHTRIIEIVIKIIPNSFIDIFTNQTYEFTFRPSNWNQMIGQITTKPYFSSLELDLITNTSVYGSYFWIRNVYLFTSGIIQGLNSLLLIVKACIPSTLVCNYAFIQLTIQQPDIFPPKLSQENVTIFIPSSQPIPSQIFQMTSYDLDGVIEPLIFTFTTFSTQFNITPFGSIFILEQSPEITQLGIRVTDSFGAYSDSQVYMHIFTHFNKSNGFDTFYNISIDPILNPKFRIPSLSSGVYQYDILFTSPSNALFVNNSREIEIRNTQTKTIETVLIIYSTEDFVVDYASLLINILQRNHAPYFPADFVNVYIYTNTSLGSIHNIPSALDGDEGVNGVISYSITFQSPNIAAIFSINADNGSLTLIRNLTEFQFHIVNITILASDQGVPPLTDDFILTVNIQPSVTIYFETGTMMYDVTLPNSGSLFQVTPIGPLDGVILNIIDISPSRDFFVNNSGHIFATSPLHTLFAFRYSLTLQAKLGLSITETNIIINIHFTFEFEFDTYQLVLPENSSINRVIFSPELNTIVSPVQFRIEPQYSEFAVNLTGNVLLVRELDFESRQSYHITLYGYSHYLQRTIRTNLVLNVTDVNDNSPILLGQPPYLAHVFSFAFKFEVYHFVAVDSDSGVNEEISYGITTASVSDLFSISSDGVLSFLRFPDPFSNGYSVVLAVSDNGNPSLTSTFILTITVHHNPPLFLPIFEHDVYEIEIPEDFTDSSVPVGIIRAFSPLSIQYSILHNPSNFQIQIQPNSQIIFIRDSLDFELTQQFSITLLANDSNSTQTCLILFNVLDINDNSPQFESQYYEVDLNENNEIGDLVLSLVAMDVDSSSNGDLVYFFGSENLTNFFDLSGNNLTAKIEFDFELNQKFEFEIYAKDQGTPSRSTSCFVVVNIVNLNDNKPVVQIGTTVLNLAENVNISSEIFTIPAVDMDNITPLTFTLQNGYTYFSITNNTGSLFLVLTPSRGIYELNINISDGLYTTDVTIFILVGNVNDNTPEIDVDSCSGNLFENSPNNTFVGQVMASDLDIGKNGEISYSILTNFDIVNENFNEIGPNVYTDVFGINSSTGIITTNYNGDILVGDVRTIIDAEFNSQINLDVIARDGGGREDFCRFQITVLDLNDNIPVFDREVYTVRLRQTLPSMYIVTVYAFDPDQGTNGDIRYSLSGDGLFLIDPNRGIITSYDFNPTNNYSLTVRAVNGFSSGSGSRSTVIVDIVSKESSLLSFSSVPYELSIDEDHVLNAPIIQVNASTSSTNSPVFYSISPGSSFRGNSEGHFLMNGITGEVSVSRHLDYERLRPGPFYFYFLIRASNTENQVFAYMNISVKDVNDNYPTFLASSLTFHLNEGLPNRTIVGRLTATDMDSGNNSEVEYFLHEISLGVPFSIGIDGVISSNEVFDYENPLGRIQFSFFGIARDKCFPDCSKSRSVYVIVNINDLNDNKPVFENDTADSISLREDLKPRKGILEISASDLDEISQAVLTYSIKQGNTNSVFSIDPNNGRLNLDRSLDFETTPFYDLVIEVTDLDYSSLHSLRVEIEDIDDTIPVFSQTIYEVEIFENIPIGTSVVQVNATDIDLPENEFIYYEISNFSTGSLFFDIDNRTGFIYTIFEIDRESHPLIQFFCFAADSNNNRGITMVRAVVMDINEPPFFPKTFYTSSISENENVVLVGHFFAIDRDEGSNALLRYSLILNPDNGFSVNVTTGHIFTNKSFDFELETHVILVLQVLDHGLLPLSATTTIQINIEDVNDHPPYFVCTEMYIRIFDNVSVNSIVSRVRILDLDKIPVFNLVLLTHNIPFELSPATGDVILRDSLNQSSYRLELLLSDDFLNFQKFGNLTISVLPLNHSPPTFTGSTNQFRVSSEAIKSAEIGTIYATDTEDQKLTFSLNDTRIFRIHPQTGTISLESDLVPIPITDYNLTVTVTDSGYPQLSTNVLVNIFVYNAEENKLIFSQPYYVVELSENAIIPNFLQLKVRNFSPVTFTIEASEYFSIDSTNGNLSLIQSLDHEFQASYNISIEASGGNGMFGSSYVIVNVLDVNDNPTFETFSNIYIHLSELEPILVPIPFNDSDSSDNFQNCALINGSEFRIFPNCSLEVPSDTPIGAYSVIISGGDGLNELVNNHININVNKFPVINTNNIFSITLTNSISETFKIIPDIETRLSSILRQDVSLFSIEELPHGTLVHFYFYNTIDISTILYSIYSNRKVLFANGIHLFSIGNDLCNSEPCLNGGACDSFVEIGPIKFVSSQQNLFISPYISHSYECICTPGSTGVNCAINIDDCKGVICENGGNCVDLLQNWICECPQGVSGRFCEVLVDHCSPNTCRNSGICISSAANYSCVCEREFYGVNCEFSRSNPLDLCDEIDCQNNSSCTAIPSDYTCHCQPGFTGDTCSLETESQNPCISNPCQYGGDCVRESNMTSEYRCQCAIGFTGPDCCYALDACELFPCKNGGKCVKGFYGDYFCDCLHGFKGENCEEMLSPCDVAECHNGGRCQETGNGYMCSCPIGFVGETCQLPTFPPDFCAQNLCSDQSNCTSGYTNYTCSCFEGVSGELCRSVSQPDSPCDANPCQHQGMCVNTGNGFICECLQGFTGKQCGVNRDECSENPCKNGICVDGMGDYKCNCFESYFGRNCSGRCPIGFGGLNCGTHIQFCSVSSCEDGFECRAVANGFECHCPDGLTGDNCETSLSCDNVDCMNGGDCSSDLVLGFKCNCPVPFSGRYCEIFSLSSFTGQSFIHFPGHLLPNQDGSISLQILTPSKNGIVLFATNFFNSESNDFIILDVINSVIRLTISFGVQTYVLHDCTGLPINDLMWHNISIGYTMDRISVCVDNCQDKCHLSINQSFHSIDGIIGLFLGGIPLDSELKLAPNFTGCLQELNINKQPIDLQTGMHRNTMGRCQVVFSSPCDAIECQPQSSCVETANGPTCTCNHGYFGLNCEELVPSITLGSDDFVQVESKNRITRDLSSQGDSKNRIVRGLSGLGVLLNSFSVAILPISDSGLILNISDGTHILKLKLTTTHFELETETNSISVPKRISTNPWFEIEFFIVGSTLSLRSKNETTKLELNSFVALNTELSTIYIGGFQGCIQDLRLNEFQLQDSNPAFRLVTSWTEPTSRSGCPAACSKSICAFGQCVPSSTNQNGYICRCQDGSYRPICTDEESIQIPVYVWILLILGFLLFVIVVTVVLVATYWGHRHFTVDDKMYSVQVYENEESTGENMLGVVGMYSYEGGGEVNVEATGEEKSIEEPSILSDDLNETKKFEHEHFRSVMLRREAFLCDDDSNRHFSDSEGDDILTNSLSRDSELNSSHMVSIGTIYELGSPFKQLRDVIYSQLEGDN